MTRLLRLPAVPESLHEGWLWALIGSGIGGAVAAVMVAVLIPTPYRAEATLVVVGPAPTRELQLTYVDLALAPGVVERASAITGVAPARIRDDVRVVPAPQSLLIRVFATSKRQGDATAMANAIARSLPAYLQDTGLDNTQSLRRARAASTADPVALPLGASAAFGALAGLALCWVTIRLRPNSQSPDPHFESNLSRTTLAPHSLSDDSDDTHVKTAPVGPVDL